MFNETALEGAKRLAKATAQQVAELLVDGIVTPAQFTAWLRDRERRRGQRNEKPSGNGRQRRKTRRRVSRDWPLPREAYSTAEIRAAADDDARSVVDPTDRAPLRV